ncbi:MAG TPA: ParB/RepB/Spo0J family partition protein [Chthonomonadaceae bacterium]|nr:ParB/RepB/Spo0J family partition protein [Chthonomonadaceae bacterium]
MGKRGLGRGLAALIPETEAPADGGAQVREIPVGQVEANPYQPRTLFDPLKMEELVASVKEHGILQPVLVRRIGHERYQLVAGERRFRAAQAAGLATVPALVRGASERELLEMAVVENVQREDIGPMEAARAYRRLIDEFGMTQETIAQRVGKSRSGVANVLRLLKLPEAIQESIEREEITEGHARALMMIEDEPSMLNAWKTVVKRQLSVRDTERLAKELRERAANAAPVAETARTPLAEGGKRESAPVPASAVVGADANEAAIVEDLQRALGTKVALRHSAGGRGRIEIEFYSPQELERLVELLLYGRQGR